jgi:dihydroxyacid dehydratase/phosphogluconate dehydratase
MPNFNEHSSSYQDRSIHNHKGGSIGHIENGDKISIDGSDNRTASITGPVYGSTNMIGDSARVRTGAINASEPQDTSLKQRLWLVVPAVVIAIGTVIGAIVSLFGK